MIHKHEWKSVYFIRQSRSLHYGRFMLSSLKEGQANILGTTIRRVLLAEIKGTRITHATRKSLPLIICCASGGARMQEGSFSLMQMGKISSRRILLFFKRRIILFIGKKKLLFLVRKILTLLFLALVIVTRSRVIVTWSRVSTIIPGPTCRSEIEPITNKHEWKSVSFIRQSRSLHYGRFMLSSGKANILTAVMHKVALAEKQIFDLDLDREEVNNDERMIENSLPLYEGFKPDSLEDEELVQLIRQSPIQIERIWNYIEQQYQSSSDNQRMIENSLPLYEGFKPDSLEDEELVQLIRQSPIQIERIWNYIEQQSQSSSDNPRMIQNPLYRRMIENPLYEGFKPDSLEDEELVQLIHQSPIQMESHIEEQSQSSSDNQRMIENPLPLYEGFKPDSLEDEEWLQFIRQRYLQDNNLVSIFT